MSDLCKQHRFIRCDAINTEQLDCPDCDLLRVLELEAADEAACYAQAVYIKQKEKIEALEAENTRLRDNLEHVLPMAKGYAYKNDVGNNLRMIRNASSLLADQPPTARSTDPETSHDAAKDAVFNQTMNQLNVLLELHKFGPLTDFQLERRTGIHQNSIGKRRGECRDARLVEMHIIDGVKVKRKSRPGSKSNAQVWRLTEAGTVFIREWMERNDE